MTKKDMARVTAYRMSDKQSLHDAYGRFSNAKAEAWRYCEDLMNMYDGEGLKVIGANSSFFSAGFLFEEDGKKKLMYITHGGDYKIDLEEDK